MSVNRRALDRQRENKLERPPAIVNSGERLQGILNAVVPQTDGTGYIHELNRLWEQVRDKFLAMGEYLELAKANLPHGHYEMMFADSKRNQPSEILSLVRELRAPVCPSRQEALARERQNLVKEMHRIRDRLTEIEEEIGPSKDEGKVIDVDVAA